MQNLEGFLFVGNLKPTHIANVQVARVSSNQYSPIRQDYRC